MTFDEYLKVKEEYTKAKTNYGNVNKIIIQKAENITVNWNNIFNRIDVIDDDVKIKIELIDQHIKIFWLTRDFDAYDDYHKVWQSENYCIMIPYYNGEKYCTYADYPFLIIPIKDIFDEEKIINQWLKDKKELDRKENEQEILERERKIQEMLDKKENERNLYLELKKKFGE